jgi:hypothetical protein
LWFTCYQARMDQTTFFQLVVVLNPWLQDPGAVATGRELMLPDGATGPDCPIPATSQPRTATPTAPSARPTQVDSRPF